MENSCQFVFQNILFFLESVISYLNNRKFHEDSLYNTYLDHFHNLSLANSPSQLLLSNDDNGNNKWELEVVPPASSQ